MPPVHTAVSDVLTASPFLSSEGGCELQIMLMIWSLHLTSLYGLSVAEVTALHAVHAHKHTAMHPCGVSAKIEAEYAFPPVSSWLVKVAKWVQLTYPRHAEELQRLRQEN